MSIAARTDGNIQHNNVRARPVLNIDTCAMHRRQAPHFLGPLCSRPGSTTISPVAVSPSAVGYWRRGQYRREGGREGETKA